MKESFNSDRDRQASGAWLKYKVDKSRKFVIGGYTPGNPLDAVLVGYYERDRLIDTAKIRNGFVPRVRREVWQKLKGLEIISCPFANLPEKKRTQFSLSRRNEELHLAKTAASGAHRVYRMDA